VYRAPATGTRSRGIVHRQPAINKLAPKLTLKPNPNPTRSHPTTNPTRTLTLTLTFK